MPKNTCDLLYYAIQSFYTVSDCAEMHEVMMLMRKAAKEFDLVSLCLLRDLLKSSERIS